MESLYRKYRPLTFDSVVGQQHIVSTLEHAITEGRLSHAYLFCGPRGTGKTTMARILAKALLCRNAEAARAEGASGCMPDGTCEECELIAEGNHPDVYELDAASRTGVDNVREEIINSVNFAPVRGKYKIYIIDEVHMLTTAAFNALLKTLEEPPAHVIFVLCTTDPQKILETILSRCQRFDFHRIGNEDIEYRLAYVGEQEGFDYADEALAIVARHAKGGMRDALSTLEQLSVFGNGAVHADDARSLLGEVSDQILGEFSRAIADRDVAELYGLIRAQVEEGNDLLELTRDLVAHVRDVYVACVAGARAELFEGGSEQAEALAAEAAAFGEQFFVVVEKVEREIEQAAGNRLAAPRHMLFRQMQAAHAAYQYRGIGLQLVNLAGFIGVADGAIHRIAQINLAINDFVPVRGQRVLKICHKDFHIGVEGVNYHFALYRSGDFHPTIL